MKLAAVCLLGLSTWCAGLAACNDEQPSTADPAADAADGATGTPTVDASDADGQPLRDGGVPPDDHVAPPPSADALMLDDIQRTTLRYFWDFAHPGSGMARERSGSGDITTSGGTGFGIHAILVGVRRGWITRTEARDRLIQLVTFLKTADRFHGAYSHWLHGATGKAIAFSAKDDGGDLVETSFLMHGLLLARAFFAGTNAEETSLRADITALWEAVDWAFYASRGDGRLYWHWSPNHGWDMNLPIRGYNEALVTYVLALASPTHPLAQAVYDATWTHAGYKNDRTFEGYQLPLGPNYGGPLFFEHYSNMVLDPRKLADTHASYWYQAVVHTRINRAYCVGSADPAHGYGPDLWGLTASDNPDGYAAHSPTDDNGTIAPTAALSSMPFTPHESLQVARYLYGLGGGVFAEHGFVDALNPSRGWQDDQVIAIDQGPIVTMIENYRSGFLWELFMQIPEVQVGLQRARVGEPDHATGFYLAVPDAADGHVHLVRHPDRAAYELDVAVHDAGNYSLVIETTGGLDVSTPWSDAAQPKGTQRIALGPLTPGPYVVRLSGVGVSRSLPIYAH